MPTGTRSSISANSTTKPRIATASVLTRASLGFRHSRESGHPIHAQAAETDHCCKLRPGDYWIPAFAGDDVEVERLCSLFVLTRPA